MSSVKINAYGRASFVLVASALLTFLFASAVAAMTQGSSRQREAIANAEQVVAIATQQGSTVKLGEERKLVLINTGSANELARGNGQVVEISGSDEDVEGTTVVALLGASAATLNQQISARAALFSAVAENPNDRARLAAQDLAAIWRGRGVRAAVLPDGFDNLDSNWRCAVVEGLSLGGVGAIHRIESPSQRTESGCSRAVRGEALLTTSLDAAVGELSRRVIFSGDAGSAGRAILAGAMAGSVPLNLANAQQEALAMRAKTQDNINDQLGAAALALNTWVGTLPAKGNRPSSVPPATPKKKRSAKTNPSGNGMVESEPDSGSLIKKPKSSPQTQAPAPAPTPAPAPQNQPGTGNGTGGSPPPDCRSGDC